MITTLFEAETKLRKFREDKCNELTIEDHKLLSDIIVLLRNEAAQKFANKIYIKQYMNNIDHD